MQCSFNSLAVTAPCDEQDAFFDIESRRSRGSKISREPDENCDIVAGPLSAVVLSEFPYRICDVTDAFASTLGFKREDLKNSSLRLTFGPKTDVKRLHSVLSGKTNCEDDVCLYRKDGGELVCWIRSNKSNLPNGDSVFSITISTLNSGRKFVTVEGCDSDTEKKLNPAQFQVASSIIREHEPTLSRDPALLAHINAIRRSRQAAARSVLL